MEKIKKIYQKLPKRQKSSKEIGSVQVHLHHTTPNTGKLGGMEYIPRKQGSWFSLGKILKIVHITMYFNAIPDLTLTASAVITTKL